MDVSVIIPTYNEKDNLPVLVKKINAVFKNNGHDYEIIVVDDDSPDKTWEVASDLAKIYPLRVKRRRDESGLATAVVAGISLSKHDTLLVMDADLQHPPEDIPTLLEEIERGADIVVGSRFVDEGSVGEFDLSRHLMSIGANYLARIFFPSIWSIEDIQSGFFAMKQEVIEGIQLRPIGFKILLEILVRGKYDTVVERGYQFDERRGGTSSITWVTIIRYVQHLLRLKIDSITSS